MVAADSDTECATSDVLNHTCTLPYSQKLTGASETIYITCMDGGNNNYSSGALSIQADVVTNNSFYRLDYNITDYMNISDDITGEIEIHPTETYNMVVCLNDGSYDIPGSCKTYTAGEWGEDTIITHTQVPKWYLNESFDYRLNITWNRIKYIDMNDSTLNNKYDHNGTGASVDYHSCNSHTAISTIVCSNTTHVFLTFVLVEFLRLRVIVLEQNQLLIGLYGPIVLALLHR